MGQKRYTQGGQAILTAVLFFLVGSLVVLGGVSAPVLRDIRTTGDLIASRQSFALAEGGAEEVAYRLREGFQISALEMLVEGGTIASTSVATILGGREVLSDGDARKTVRKAKIALLEGEGVAFNYGMQADTGGFDIQNSAQVQGNAFSNGPVTGENNNIVGGDIISASSNGLIDGVHATGTAYAHTIQDSTVDKDAYYQIISNSTVAGTQFPGSSDQATTSLPIADEQIESWKQQALAGGVVSCSEDEYEIKEDIVVGPVKIPCDLEVSGSPTITLTGPVWVEGDIEVSNTAEFYVDNSLSGKSVQVIADNPTDRITSSTINLQNSVEFFGAGDNSHVLFISQNEDTESGGNNYAIRVQNSVSGDVLVYAAHGRIDVENFVTLKSITAYQIRLKNNTKVIYESGVANLLFDAGPSGGFTIDTWKETK